MSEYERPRLDGPRRILTHPLPHTTPASRRAAVRTVVALFGRLVDLRHADRLPVGPGASIFVFNHNNSFESVVVPAALIWRRHGRNIHFLVDWMFLRIPLVGWILSQVDPIPVYTKPARFGLWERHRQANRGRDPIQACLGLLDEGRSVGIFPEGTRNGHPAKLRRGRRGVGHLVLRSSAPVQPIGIEFPARHRLGRMPKIGRMLVTVGPPLAFDAERQRYAELLDADPGRSRRRERNDLAGAVVQRVMESLSPLCSKSCAEAPESSASRTPKAEEDLRWHAQR